MTLQRNINSLAFFGQKFFLKYEKILAFFLYFYIFYLLPRNAKSIDTFYKNFVLKSYIKLNI